VDLGVQYNILNKSGAWYSYGDQRIGQGRENTKKFLKEHPDIAAEVEEKIRAAASLDNGEKASKAEPADRDDDGLNLTPETAEDDVE
jgi:recombination protein RecA